MPPVAPRNLERVSDEVPLAIAGVVSVRSVLDALEVRYPVLRGTIRDQASGQRRPLVRFFACGEDVSHAVPDAPLPGPVAQGAEPLCLIGAMTGGGPALRRAGRDILGPTRRGRIPVVWHDLVG